MLPRTLIRDGARKSSRARRSGTQKRKMRNARDGRAGRQKRKIIITTDSTARRRLNHFHPLRAHGRRCPLSVSKTPSRHTARNTSARSLSSQMPIFSTEPSQLDRTNPDLTGVIRIRTFTSIGITENTSIMQTNQLFTTRHRRLVFCGECIMQFREMQGFLIDALFTFD